MTNILYIHGAYASPTSFGRFIDGLPDHRVAYASYCCLTTPVATVVRDLRALTAAEFAGEPYSIVAHSLGGLIGVLLLRSGQPVERMFTMSSPFGGSRFASLLQMVFFHTPIFRDISPLGYTVRDVLATPITIPMVSVVTTSGGTPMFHDANDGVVTVDSQKSLTGPAYHEVAYNHFEVLLADPVLDLAAETLFV